MSLYWMLQNKFCSTWTIPNSFADLHFAQRMFTDPRQVIVSKYNACAFLLQLIWAWTIHLIFLIIHISCFKLCHLCISTLKLTLCMHFKVGWLSHMMCNLLCVIWGLAPQFQCGFLLKMQINYSVSLFLTDSAMCKCKNRVGKCKCKDGNWSVIRRIPILVNFYCI